MGAQRGQMEGGRIPQLTRTWDSGTPAAHPLLSLLPSFFPLASAPVPYILCSPSQGQNNSSSLSHRAAEPFL